MKKLLLAAGLLLAAQSAFAALPVAVVEAVCPKDWNPAAAEVLTAKLTEQLLANKALKLVDRTNLVALMKEQEFQANLLDRQARSLGELSGADYIIIPKAARLGSTFFLAARMIHVASGEVAAQISLEDRGTWDSFPALAARLAVKTGETVAQFSGKNPAVATPAAAPAVLKIWSYWDSPVLDVWISDFRKLHPEISLSWENVNLGRDDARVAGFGHKSQAALLICPSDALNRLAAAGQLAPLTGLENLPWAPLARETVTTGGKFWGVPLYVGNNLLVYVNKKLLAKAPASVKDYSQVPAPAGGRGAVVNLTAGGFFHWPWLLAYSGSWQAGAEQFQPGLETLAWLKKNFWPEWTYKKLTGEFKNGRVALLVDGDWNLQPYREALKDDLLISPLPEVESGKPARPPVTVFAAQLAAGRSAAEEAAGRLFLEYLASREAQAKTIVWASLIPGLADPALNKMIDSDDFMKSLKATQAAGLAYPKTGDYWQALDSRLIPLLTGKTTAADTARSLAAEVARFK